MNPEIALIVAMGENRVIGCSEKLPWKISEELKYFKEKTLGKPVIMGRKTFQSLGKPLPGRKNIILTRSSPDQFSQFDVSVKDNLEDAISLAVDIAKKDNQPEIMIMGGADIFKQALSLVNRIYLTKIYRNYEGDALLAEFESNDWQEISSHRNKYQDLSTLEKPMVECEFLIYERKLAKNFSYKHEKICA